MAGETVDLYPWMLGALVVLPLLSGALARRRRCALSLLVALFVAGVFVGHHEAILHRAERRFVASLVSARFVQARGTIEHDWVEGRFGEHRIELSDVEIRQGRESRLIREPLFLYLSGVPPDIVTHRRVVAEALMRTSPDGRITLHVKSPRLVHLEETIPAWSPTAWNRAIGRRLDRFADSARRRESVALAKALLLGRKDALSLQTKRSYRRGGTYHLLVFSGMHIAVAAALLTILLRFAGARRSADFVLLCIALLAPSFAGNEPSVARSAWMLGLYALSRLLRRPTSTRNLLFVSALIRLIAVPGELTDAGFALTYGATGGLILVGGALHQWLEPRRRLTSALLYGAGAELSTTPLTLFYFHQFVIGSALFTILLGPVLMAMMLLSAAAAAGSFAYAPLARSSLDLIGLLDHCATVGNEFVSTTLRLHQVALAPPAFLIVIAFLLVALLATRRKAGALVPLPLLIPLVATLLLSHARGSVDAAQIEFLDVGQGDAILLRSGRHAILVDGGGHPGDDEFGERRLLPLLLDRGVRHLDVVALSHPHPDHCGGLPAVIRDLDVGEILISPRHVSFPCGHALTDAAASRAVPVRAVHDGDRFPVGEFWFEAHSADRRFKRAFENNSSIVFRVGTGRRHFLLSGDIEHEAEDDLLRRPIDFSADVLKIAHHGSRSSTGTAMLRRVHPAIAVISCGRNNLFGHPHREVTKRLAASEIRLFRTDTGGTIRIAVRVNALFVSREIDTRLTEP